MTQNFLFLLWGRGDFCVMGLDALAGDLSSAKQFLAQLLPAMLAAALILPFYGPVTAGADRVATGLCTVVANGSDLCRADFV